MRDVFTYILTHVVESGAAESWTSPITNRPTRQNPSPSHPRNGEGRLDEGSAANGEGEGKACQGRTKRTGKLQKLWGKGGEWDNSKKQTLASAILRDRGTQK